MSPGVPTKVIAASVGLSAFAVALVAGLAADNPLHVIILRAVLAMFICQAVGFLLGAIAERIVADAAAASLSSASSESSPSADAPTPVEKSGARSVQTV